VGTGVLTSVALDKLQDKADQIIGNAAAAGGLLSAKAARDLQLAIDAARVQLSDELNKNWDRMDQQKISILRALDQQANVIQGAVTQAGRIEDKVYLDADELAGKFPFVKSTPSIRRVDGASQHFKFLDGSFYKVDITGNLFKPFGPEAALYLFDDTDEHHRIDSSWLVPTPPYTVSVRIPSSVLNGHFQERTLAYVPLIVKTNVEKSGFIFGKKSVPAKFTIKIELFPKFPITYQLVEYRTQKIVDNGATSIQKGSLNVIPGCGDSGCNKYYTICTDIPAGAQPLSVAQYYDSFQGWGGFGNPRITPTGMCADYWQHSHNVTRNVGFDVYYHPTKNTTVVQLLELTPLDQAPLPTVMCSPQPMQQIRIEGFTPKIETVMVVPPGCLVDQAIQQQLQIIARQLQSPHGLLQLGRSYAVRFDSDKQSYDFVVKSFTGEEFYAVPGHADSVIDVSEENQTDFKRLVVKLKDPW
jgi:hypothetical protein